MNEAVTEQVVRSEFLRALKGALNYSETENGAVGLKSTLNACLDMFGSFAAMRGQDYEEEDFVKLFTPAFTEDPKTAFKMLFYMRDIRNGQGVRFGFRAVMKYLADNIPELVVANLDNIVEFGRADDLLCLLDTKVKSNVIDWIAYKLEDDDTKMALGQPISLLAKWLPSENASSETTKRYAKIVRSGLTMDAKAYRKMLSKMRKYLGVTEAYMSGKQWDKINYEAVPSTAMKNYTDAFYRHDETRFEEYVDKLCEGKAKVNAKALYSVDIIHNVFGLRDSKGVQPKLLNAMWNALPDFYEGKEETGICVVDVSGSMSGLPMEVAISLGMYCADKCRGPFKNHFITFSEHPQLQEIDGEDIYTKVKNMSNADWDMNTNLEAVFELILSVAVRNKLSQGDLPKKLYIISDMQFDQALDGYNAYHGWHSQSDRATICKKMTFMQEMGLRYKDAGYELPNIVYWNVRASGSGAMFQETYNGVDCCMVSGYSASLFRAIIEGTTYETVEVEDEDGNKTTTVKEHLDPMTIMLNTINNPRYDCITIDVIKKEG